jgi:N-acetylneuraminate synthase
MEFTEEQWVALREHAEDRGLIFLSSPFSIEAVDVLTRVGVPAWKVASGELTNMVMLDRMAQTALPILLSTGMSTLSEIDAAVRRVEERGSSPAVFQCTTAYPCAPEEVGINLVPVLRDRYAVPIGLSDHSGTIFPGLAAATTGIDALEVHVVFSREAFGPDVQASVTTNQLRELVEGVRFIEAMNANPVDKDQIAEGFAELRGMFTKSVVITCDLEAGTVLQEDHLTLKKPGWGIDASRLPDLVGRRLVRPLAADSLLAEGDLD